MTDNKPTTAQCREFTLLMGVEWHEIKSEGYYDGIRQVEQPKCSCGKSFLFLSELKDHIARNNPTYSDSASILLKMREQGLYEPFICYLFDEEYTPEDIKECSMMGDTLLRILDYIFNPALLIGKAIEWMRKEKGE